MLLVYNKYLLYIYKIRQEIGLYMILLVYIRIKIKVKLYITSSCNQITHLDKINFTTNW